MMWSRIDDRSNAINSTTTALFNKIGSLLDSSFNRLFGDTLISSRAAMITIDLSYLAAMLYAIFTAQWNNISLPIPPGGSRYGVPIVVLALTISVLLPVLYPSKWWNLHLCYFCATWCIVSWVYLLVFDPAYRFLGPATIPSFLSLTFAVGLTCLSIALIRFLFRDLSGAVTSARILVTMVVLGTVSVLLFVGPTFLQGAFRNFPSELGGITISWMFGMMIALNMPAAFFSLLPALLLLFLMFHRLVWPIAGKAIYPLCRFTIIKSTKTLLSIGALLALVAIDPAKLDLKEILKMIF